GQHTYFHDYLPCKHWPSKKGPSYPGGSNPMCCRWVIFNVLLTAVSVSVDDWSECPVCRGAGCQPESHKWDEDGERCERCGDKDWMPDSACRGRKPEPRAEVTNAVRDVLAERRRQIEQEGWTPEHDDAHLTGDLALAAACYAIHGSERWNHDTFMWPWPKEWWKPTTPRRNLVKAGALILAEIERLDRAAARTGASSC
ncbi:hypothetical protein QZM85_27925, partial [Burkholderia cenocepacia]|nr:hypothetical protein [Burkholderia cenocepacia]